MSMLEDHYHYHNYIHIIPLKKIPEYHYPNLILNRGN